MTHKPVSYLVKQKAKTSATPDTILLRTDSIEEARTLMSEYQQRYGGLSFYIDYTEKGRELFGKKPRIRKSLSRNNKVIAFYDRTNHHRRP